MRSIAQQDVEDILTGLYGQPNAIVNSLEYALKFADSVEKIVCGQTVLTKDTVQEEWFYMADVRADHRMMVFAKNLQRIIEQKFASLCY
jgi:hypothetical protein